MTKIWIVMGLVASQAAVDSVDGNTGLARRVRMVDVDGDGRLDRVGQLAPGLLGVGRNLGERRFEESQVAHPEVHLTDVLATDLDGDGYRDLYLVGVGSNVALVGDGTGQYVDRTAELGLQDRGEGRSAERVDIDGDGLDEVLLHNVEGDVVFWRASHGGFERESGASGGGPSAMPFAPLDAARPSDLRTSEESTGHVATGVGIESHAGPGNLRRSVPAVRLGSVTEPRRESGPQPLMATEAARLACARSISDVSSSACLRADTTPTLGRLFPISQELFVQASTGRVGIGTTAPDQELSVVGDVSVSGGVELTGTGGLEFERSGASADPMITLFSDNNFSAEERMILAYSPQAPTYGLAYRDSEFDFRFQEFTDDPTFDIDMGVKLNSFVDLFLTGSNVGVQFVGDAAGAAPMITMPFGPSGADSRMVLSHSGTDPDRGLDYAEGTKAFRFQQDDATPVLTIGTQNRTVEVHERLEVQSENGEPASFSITNASNASTVFRGVTSGPGRAMFLSGLNAGATVPTLEVGALGNGDTIAGFSYGSGAAVSGEAWGASGSAGRFAMQSSTSTDPALLVTSSGLGNALEVYCSVDDESGLESIATGDRTYAIYGESPDFGVVGQQTDPGGIALLSLGDFVAGGSKMFSAPHPTDASKEIRFACLEGNESGTYFRGTGQLESGRLVIPVPDEFRFVTSEGDLSVHLTPIGGPAVIWVEAQSLEQVVVRSDADVGVHYMVQGKRRGYESWESVAANRTWVPRVADEAYGAQYPDEVRRTLVENGTLNADMTPNRATADRLGWKLRSREERTSSIARKAQGEDAWAQDPR